MRTQSGWRVRVVFRALVGVAIGVVIGAHWQSVADIFRHYDWVIVFAVLALSFGVDFYTGRDLKRTTTNMCHTCGCPIDEAKLWQKWEAENITENREDIEARYLAFRSGDESENGYLERAQR